MVNKKPDNDGMGVDRYCNYGSGVNECTGFKILNTLDLLKLFISILQESLGTENIKLDIEDKTLEERNKNIEINDELKYILNIYNLWNELNQLIKNVKKSNKTGKQVEDLVYDICLKNNIYDKIKEIISKIVEQNENGDVSDEMKHILSIYNKLIIEFKNVKTSNKTGKQVEDIMNDTHSKSMSKFPTFFDKTVIESFKTYLNEFSELKINSLKNPYSTSEFLVNGLILEYPSIFYEKDIEEPAYTALNFLKFKLYREKKMNINIIDLFDEFQKQLWQYIKDRILKFYTKNKIITAELKRIIKDGKYEIGSILNAGFMVINKQNKESGFREPEELKLGMEPINIENDEEEIKLFNTINICLSYLYSVCPYNTLDFLLQSIINKRIYEQSDDKELENERWSNAFHDTVEQKKDGDICEPFEGDICTGMSEMLQKILSGKELPEKLKEILSGENFLNKGIECDLIRFKAVRTVNDDCSGDGHVGVMIKYRINGAEKIIRVDPGLAIPKPIIFQKVDGADKIASKYPKYTCITDNMRYGLFITEGHNHNGKILGMEIANRYTAKIENSGITISIDGEELGYDKNGELKDSNEQVYKISHNMDVLNKEFPYKMYVYSKDKVQQTFYISGEGFIVKCNQPTELELDLNHSLNNPRDTIGKDYFRVLRNLSFIRYDENGKKLASIVYPLRTKTPEIIMKRKNKQTNFIHFKGGIIIGNDIRIENEEEIIDKLKELADKNREKFKKLLSFAGELKYESPSSLLYKNKKDEIVEKFKNFVEEINKKLNDSQKLAIEDSNIFRYLYNLIYSLLIISKEQESFLEYCEEQDNKPKDFYIDFDNSNRILHKGIDVNGVVHKYFDYNILELFKTGRIGRIVSLDVSYIKEISKEEVEALSKVKILSLYLNGIEELTEEKITKEGIEVMPKLQVGKLYLNGLKSLKKGAAEILGKFMIPILCLNGIEEVTKEEIEAMLKSEVLVSLHLNGLKKIGKGVLEALGKSNIKTLSLNGIEKLTEEEIEALSNLGVISLHLDGLKKIGKGVLEALGKSNIKSLSLNGIEEISKEEIEALSNFDGILYLGGIETLGEGILEIISKSKISKVYLKGKIIESKNIII